ncbi:protein Sfk1p [Monosporozyma servazzii]
MNFVKPGNYWFLLPWIAFIPWYGMLITMLICWAAQGHPIYWFMHTDQFPVYISDIGATNLRPLFIACSGWQGVGYVLVVFIEFYQRHTFRMNPWFIVHERNLIFASFVLGSIGELGLLFCTIWSTALYPNVHTAMVDIFVIFMFLSIVCLTAEYFSMGRHYALIHFKTTRQNSSDSPPPPPPPHIDDLKWWQWRGYVWNKFTISAIFKTIWLVCAVIWAIAFATIDNDSNSAKFEWLLAFWFGLIFIILSVDFYLGSIWKRSKYWPQINDYNGYYKYNTYSNNSSLDNSELTSAKTTEPSSLNDYHSTSDEVFQTPQLEVISP